MKSFIKPIVLLLLLSVSAAQASETATFDEQRPDGVSDKKWILIHEWEDLTDSQYIENRMACEYQLQAFKWSKNIWPKENKDPKPAFSETVDWDAISQKSV